jgi:hypothetical protein
MANPVSPVSITLTMSSWANFLDVLMAMKCSNYQERLPGLTDCGKTRAVEGYGLYRGKAGPPVYEKPSFCI